jgi:hypothetical protein
VAFASAGADRHVGNSIATIRRQLTVALARTLIPCPCRQATPPSRPFEGFHDVVELRGKLLEKDSQIGARLRSDMMMFAQLGANRLGGYDLEFSSA